LLIIAVIISGIIGAISYRLNDYSFVLTTAFSGAFLASLGVYGIAEGKSVADLLGMFLWFGLDDFAPILIGTIVLGIIGCTVQWRRIGKSSSSNNKPKQNVTPVYNHYPNSESVATEKQDDIILPSTVLPTKQSPNFCVKCGAHLSVEATFCTACGLRIFESSAEKEVDGIRLPSFLPIQQALSFCTKCGAQLEAETTFCTACGSRVFESSIVQSHE